MLHQGKEVTVIRPAEPGDIGYHPKAQPQFLVMDEDEHRKIVPEYVEPEKSKAEPMRAEASVPKAVHRGINDPAAATVEPKAAPVHRPAMTSPAKTKGHAPIKPKAKK